MDAAANIITGKILSDAQAAADALVADARKRAADKLRAVKKESDQQTEIELARANSNMQNLRDRNAQLAAIEQKKSDLGAKREILNTVFEQARSEILSSKNYKTFIENLVTKHCVCDACIVIGTGDEKTLTAEFISSCAAKCKCKFTRRVTDAFHGGIVIESAKYDIRLTLDDLLATAREHLEVKAAEILWG